MIAFLSLLLFVLLVSLNKKRGFKTFIALYMNYFCIFIAILFFVMGFSPIIISFILCLIISLIILFFLKR